MTRCLFWNVERFNMDRFYSPSNAQDSLAPMTQALSATRRKTLLHGVIAAADPDIIVIVETVAQSAGPSKIAQRMVAPVTLLNELRTTAPTVASAEWRLVPPLLLAGQPNNAGQEAISVFYRGLTGTTLRFFTGPNIWPGGVDGPPVLPGAGTPKAYGTNRRLGQNEDLNAFLVPTGTTARTIPNGALHNANILENTVAARTGLRDVNAGAPGNVIAFGTARPPFMVSFTEQDNQGALRDVTLFCVHGPANEPGATAFIAALSTAFEIIGPLGGHETRLIGGDFNANLLQADGSLNTVFAPLTTTPGSYSQLLQPTAAPQVPPSELAAWKGYFGTCIVPVDKMPPITNHTAWQSSRFLWSDDATASYYPPYGYQDSRYPSIDNVLVRPLVNGRDYQTTIMNTVVSSPMSAVNPVPVGATAGSIAIAAEIAAVGTAAWPQAPAADDYDQTIANQLIDWDHYGHIASTSDHFALFVDV